MTSFVVVGGSPVVALIAALYAVRRFAHVRVSLDMAVAEEAEVFRPHRLTADLRAMTDGLIVRGWDRFQTFEGTEGKEFEEPLVLVDPLQCRIELERFADRVTFRRRASIGSHVRSL